MNTPGHHRQEDAVARIRRGSAFTMVEVAIALGVIAIALVAILGIMPTGLRVQQENREDTLMNADGWLLLEALRSGRDVGDRRNPVNTRDADWPNSLDYLTNYVLAVAITNVVDGARVFVNPYLLTNGQVAPFGRLGNQFLSRPILTNGLHILGLLGRPRVELRQGVTVTNYVAGLVRSISGPASDQGTVGREFALTYVVSTELTPFGKYPNEWLDFRQPGLPPEQILARSNLYMRAINQGVNFSELRLSLNGPAYETRRQGVARWQVFKDPKVFRTLVSGRIWSYLVQNDPDFVVTFLIPNGYGRVSP